MNMRVDEQGNAVREGEQIVIGGNERYIATCRKHFHQGQASAVQVTSQVLDEVGD